MRPAARRIAMMTVVALVLGAVPVSGAGRPSFISRHQIEGDVDRIDGKTGALTIATRAGMLKLDAPLGPAAHLAKGTAVTVEVALFRGSPPAPASYRADSSLLRRRVTAEVIRVDRTAGQAQLGWPGTALKFDVPSPTLQNLKKGDRIPVELTVDLSLTPAASARTDAAERQRRGGLAAFLLGILGRK